MASGKFNTMAEGLSKVVQDLTLLMAAPDSDDEFLSELVAQIMGKLKLYGNPSGPPPNPIGREAPPQPPEMLAALGGPMSPPGAGGPPPGMPGMPPGMGAGPGAPNEDELRRLMG